ncbi:hypothetical protein FQN54_007026 [Arachnomyces sp. PD_36]|nr:hypothetical protein FQN54_007026 [Arachnomyces sp. PD_36]
MSRPRCCEKHPDAHPVWVEGTEISVPKCATTCEFCGHKPKGGYPAAALRVHLRRVHTDLDITVKASTGGRAPQ